MPRNTLSPSLPSLALLLAGCVGSIPGGTEQPSDETPPEATQPAGVPPGSPAGCAPTTARIWRLTPEQYGKTLRSLLPGLSGDPGGEVAGTLPPSQGRFTNSAADLVMSVPHVSQLVTTTGRIVDKALTDPAKISPCLAAPDASCMRLFIDGFGARAFRRPLLAAETDVYLAAFQKNVSALGVAAARRTLLATFLLSPHFLFRTELGAPDRGANATTLTAFEKASALSYFLTDGPPDPPLFQAAKEGNLDVAVQARRLLASADSAPGIGRFLAEHFNTREVLGKTKEVKIFKNWSQELAADMASEADLLLRDVLWGGSPKLSTLFTSSTGFVNARLAPLYDLPAPGTAGFQKVALPPTLAGGLLVKPVLMADLAQDDDTAPVARGRFVREVLLCQDLPEPPADLNVVAPPPDGKRTQRDRLGRHSMDPGCASCHRLMDPLGLAFENFDGIGHYRTSEAGKVIDTSGTLTGAAPEGTSFKNAVELSALLARSPDVNRCFVRSAFTYATGRNDGADDRCAIDRLDRRFAESGGDILDLVVAMVTDQAFVVRGTP